MLLVVRGTALWLTDGFPQRTWDAGDQWMRRGPGRETSSIGGLRIYMSLIWFILLAVVFHYLLTRTRFGNWIQATGGNPGAARNRGVPIKRVKMILFMLSLRHGGLRRAHLLDPRLGGEPELGRGLRA